ncbi:MAG: hypothetical protein BGO21_30810 [Dyadobacter sp. 50-39]|nr:MAG: hypothetical protein BGO21_30810 [Dyadobacter sp. 50-39]
MSIIAGDQYWDDIRRHYFDSRSINLNPGSVGTTSSVVRNVRVELESEEVYANPIRLYELARVSYNHIVNVSREIWSSEGYIQAVLPSASQMINIICLNVMRRLRKGNHAPFKVFTSAFEHEGGIGPFLHLPEFAVEIVPDQILNEDRLLRHLLGKEKPDIIFISHVRYADGIMPNIESIAHTVKDVVPNAIFILDAAQSLGIHSLPFGLVDVIFGSTHKWLFGPHGGGLAWFKLNFCQWIEGIFWTGNGLFNNNVHGYFDMPGGQSFSLYKEISVSLDLYQSTGPLAIFNRSCLLCKYARKRMIGLFEEYGIHFDIISDEFSPMFSVSLRRLDAYPLYKYLICLGVSIKYIKDYTYNGSLINIIRFGFPYYESISRIEAVIEYIRRYLHDISLD